MAISEARKRANEKYLKSQDEFKIRMPQGKKEVLKKCALSQGKSLNIYIKGAIKKQYKEDTGEEIEL